MSKRIIAHLFSTDPDFTDWPIECDGFTHAINSIGFDLPTVSFINYLTDALAERDGCNFKQYLLNLPIYDQSEPADEEHVVFVHSNVNDSKLMYAIDVFTQFCGLYPMTYRDVSYGRKGDVVFVANRISKKVNGIVYGSYITNMGWVDDWITDWEKLPKVGCAPPQYRPHTFDIIDEYTKLLIEYHRSHLSTNKNFGRVFMLYIIIGDVPDDSAYYTQIQTIRNQIEIRFGDTGCEWPRFKPQIIRYNDLPDMLYEDDDVVRNINNCAFMLATPDSVGMGLSDSEARNCIRMIESLYDRNDKILGLTESQHIRPNGDKIIYFGPVESFIERVKDSDILASNIMRAFFDDMIG